MTVMLLTAVIGTVGFSLIFKIKLKHLPFAAIGGLLACSAFLVAQKLGCELFSANYIAAALSAAYSEICARLLRAPATVFLVPCAITLVPGGSLFYAMSYLLSENTSLAHEYLLSSVLTGTGIAGGIITVSVIAHIIIKATSRLHRGATSRS